MSEDNIETFLPISKTEIGAGLVETTDLRKLHAWLEVGRDFSNWVKDRIAAYGFVEGVDFVTVSRSPESGSGNRGADGSPNLANQTGRGGDRRSIDYFATLDMAKELSMVERNEKGRQARRYYIRCERIAKAASEGLTANQTGGISRAVVRKALADFRAVLMEDVTQLVRTEVAAITTPNGQYKTAVEYQPALAITERYAVPQKGRGALVRRLSNALDKFCRREGIPVRLEAHTDRRLFHVDAIERFLLVGGLEIIRRHTDKLAGQGRFRMDGGRRAGFTVVGEEGVA